MGRIGAVEPDWMAEEQCRVTMKLMRTSQRMRNAAPDLGARTEEILQSLGHGDEDIRQLREEGVV